MTRSARSAEDTRLVDGPDARTKLTRVDVEAFDTGITKTVYQFT